MHHEDATDDDEGRRRERGPDEVDHALDPFTEPEDPVVRGASTLFPSPELHPLDPRWVTATRITGAIRATITALVLAGAAVWAALAEPVEGLPWWTWPALAVLLALARFAHALVMPALVLRFTRFRADGSGIEIRSGVLTRRVVTVARSRIQHTDVSRGPIERAFGLATLVIYTAGTESAEIPLAGLSDEVAVELRDFLLAGGDRDAED